MNNDRSIIGNLTTGIPGLDRVLGGGLPEYSFNLVAGAPGSGKTTLVQQIVFGNATEERPALYFTVLGEPTLKMLRYQSQFSFFDSTRVGRDVQFLNLSDEVMNEDLDAVLARIVTEVEKSNPSIIAIDSFRTVYGQAPNSAVEKTTLDGFVQRLSLYLTTWEVTSFLISDYPETDARNPVFTIADAILWLSQVADRNSVVRKLQVLKTRGRAPMPGLHTFRITDGGLQVFPRIPEQQRERTPQTNDRQSTGVPGLDEIMGGGIPRGDAVLLAGPAGSGKSTIATQFVAQGFRDGGAAVVVVFEEYPDEYMARAKLRGHDIQAMKDAGKLKLVYFRPLDLSVDETLAEILESVDAINADRVIIDSLSGFEVALAPGFREDFRESLYRLVGALTGVGVTVFMTAEIVGGYPDVRFTSEKVSFITDDIIVQRFIEIEGQLKKVLVVVKMRGSSHSPDFRTYEIGANGVVVGGSLKNYHGITTGVPSIER